MAPGAACHLAELGRHKAAVLPAVELAVGCEGDVIDIEIKPHADRIRRNDVVDVAVLKDTDLSVARARRKRAKDDRSPAALAADPFRNGVDVLGRESDDGAAPRKAANFPLARKAQAGEPGPRDNSCAGQESAYGALHCASADEQSLSRPRQLSTRSVKICPRSGSAAS